MDFYVDIPPRRGRIVVGNRFMPMTREIFTNNRASLLRTLDFEDNVILVASIHAMSLWPERSIIYHDPRLSRDQLSTQERNFLKELCTVLMDSLKCKTSRSLSSPRALHTWILMQMCARRAEACEDAELSEEISQTATHIPSIFRKHASVVANPDTPFFAFKSFFVHYMFDSRAQDTFVKDIWFIMRASNNTLVMIGFYNPDTRGRHNGCSGDLDMMCVWTDPVMLDVFEKISQQGLFKITINTYLQLSHNTCLVHMLPLVQDTIALRYKSSLQKIRICKLLSLRRLAGTGSLSFVSQHQGLEHRIVCLARPFMKNFTGTEPIHTIMRDLYTERALAISSSGFPWLVVYEILAQIMPEICNSLSEFLSREIVRVAHQATRKALLARE